MDVTSMLSLTPGTPGSRQQIPRGCRSILTPACEAEVVPQWTDRLAGADVFTADHCYRIIESLRID